MKEGWQIKKLGDLATYVNGFAFKPSDWSNTGLRIIRIQNLNSEKDDYHYYSGDILPRYRVKKGDVLISWSASLGVYVWKGNDAWLNQHIFKVVFDKDEINTKFFVYVVEALLSEMKKLVHGATMQHITKGKFDNIDVPVPPLSEQQRIVSLLDAEFAKIDVLKANAEKNLQNAKDLFCSIQTKVLENKSWKRFSLDEICNLITDGTHRTPNYQQQGIPFLSVKNITSGFLDLNDTKYISEEEHRELVKRCKPEIGDVLYSKVGTTGVAQLIDTEEEFSIFVSLALLKVKQEIVKNTLLVKILNSPYVREQAKKRTRGTANKNFVISDIKAVDVYIPPYNEQDVIEHTIDTYWSKVSSLQANYEKTLSLCDDLKQALLRKAFNGEI